MIDSVRGLVITHSVAVEQMITNQISLLLGISKTKSSLFGTGSGSMPFHFKIGLLQELNFYDATQKQKLTRFSEIRNKFAHLAEIETFSDCFLALDGLIKNVKKWYPTVDTQIFSSDEERYKAYYNMLFLEISEQVARFVKYYNDRLHIKTELELKKQHFDYLVNAIEETQKEYSGVKVIEEFVEKVFTRSIELYQKNSDQAN